MKKTKFKSLALISLSAILALSAGGCGEKQKGTLTSSSDLSKYPIQTDTTLTYWMALPSNVSASYSNFGDTPYAKELEERTGVKVKYIHPALGQEAESFSLMIASNELADLIEYDWLTSIGGPSASIKDKVINSLNDAIDQYAPNLKKYLDEHPDLQKDVKTDDGFYYVFPLLRSDDKLLVSYGPVVRKDWLDELGLEVPTCTADWENMLKLFKEKKGASAPVTIKKAEISALFAIMDAYDDFYVDNGQIKYGPLEKEYREAVETLRRWYADGLIDKNFITADGAAVDSNILNGKSGATFGSGGSGLGKWLNAKKDSDPTYDLVAVPTCGTEKGSTSRFSFFSNPYGSFGSTAISSSCKDVALAAKYLDYNYSEEGHMLNNFGVEGVSYTMVDGTPKYTELITNDPNGLSMSQAMGQYIRACMTGPYVQDVGYIEQYYALPQQQNALTVWSSGLSKAKGYKMPSVTFSTDESDEYSAIYTELTKHRDSNVTAFITGTKSMDEFDTYIQGFSTLNVEKAIQIRQAALDRYKNR